MADKKSNKRESRYRNWSFFVYPDSAPQNWRDILDDEHFAWIESPLHDKDVDADGEIKKPHWHVFVSFNGVQTYETVKEITNRLNSPHPQHVKSPIGTVRYMIHLDNPEKFQYPKNEIVCHGGADLEEYFKTSATDRYIFIDEMVAFIKANEITELCDLIDYARANRREDWFKLLCDSCAYFMNQYIKSVRFKLEKQKESNKSV
jgi:hypothetical protein